MADNTDVRSMLQGFLNKKVYVVTTRPVRPGDMRKRYIEKYGEEAMAKISEDLISTKLHLENQIKLEKEGIMFAAGPLYEEDGQSPWAGMFVLRANSFEEARAIADADPLHQADLREYEIRRWTMNEGSIQLTVNFSDQSASIV